MKTSISIYIVIFVCSVSVLFTGCENPLEEKAYSELPPDDILNNKEGIEAVLVSAYGNIVWANLKMRLTRFESWPADLGWQTGGVENRTALTMMEWTWDASQGHFNGTYNRMYNVVRDANLILDNVDEVEGISEEDVNILVAEARFLRAWAYYRLYIYFGPTPLRKSTDDPQEMARASEEEMKNFIETEIQDVIPDLPDPGEEANYGRATNGGAMGLLTKFYLNTKQWEEAAQTAQDIIAMNEYELFPVFEDLLKVENEGNSEMILVNTLHPDGPFMNYMEGAFPPGFFEWPEKNLVNTSWENHATQHRLRDDFYYSFDPEDERRNPILTEYVNVQGDTVDLLNDAEDNTRAFRFWPDPDAQGNRHGNDMPEVRYADILLSRAEALNEIQGPNQESINLINEVRARAGLEGLSLAEFSSKEELRDHIFDERAWEFYEEAHRRTDLIRKGEFVENAIERGVDNAAEYRIVYPIPQPALDANPLLEQNPGY